MFKKIEKEDFKLVQLYQIISLHNCIRKIVEKVVANQLFDKSKRFFKLYPRQIKVRKKRFAIDKVTTLVHTIEKI